MFSCTSCINYTSHICLLVSPDNRFSNDLHPAKEPSKETFRVVLGWAYRGLTGGFLLLQNFSVAISVRPHVCFILVLILISVFLK